MQGKVRWRAGRRNLLICGGWLYVWVGTGWEVGASWAVAQAMQPQQSASRRRRVAAQMQGKVCERLAACSLGGCVGGNLPAWHAATVHTQRTFWCTQMHGKVHGWEAVCLPGMQPQCTA
jgi:hypothetical protein